MVHGKQRLSVTSFSVFSIGFLSGICMCVSSNRLHGLSRPLPRYITGPLLLLCRYVLNYGVGRSHGVEWFLDWVFTRNWSELFALLTMDVNFAY